MALSPVFFSSVVIPAESDVLSDVVASVTVPVPVPFSVVVPDSVTVSFVVSFLVVSEVGEFLKKYPATLLD